MSGFVHVAHVATPAKRGVRATLEHLFVAPLRRARERARIWHELAAMSDRELADIGLTRGAIPMVAAGRWGAAGDRDRVHPTRPANVNAKHDDRAAAA